MRKALAAMMLSFAVGSWQVASVAARSDTGKTPRAITASNSRPLCKHGYHLRGSRGRGFTCSRRGHHDTKPHCQANYRLRTHRRGSICIPAQRRTSTPVSLSGSITNVHIISGHTMQATYTISSSGCGGYCYTFARAFQVPASQSCVFGNGVQKWIFTASASRLVPYTETSTANFTNGISGPMRLCLFVLATTPPSAPTENLVAQTTFVPPSAGTPLTVANICSFNPGLGVPKHVGPYGDIKGTVFWTNSAGAIEFGAANYEGDSQVDVAFTVTNGILEWIAFCPPHETHWINVPKLEKEPPANAPPPVTPQPVSSQAGPSAAAFEGIYSTITAPDVFDTTQTFATSTPAIGDVIDGNFVSNVSGGFYYGTPDV